MRTSGGGCGDDPLSTLSPSLKRIFLNAGWVPGRNRRTGIYKILASCRKKLVYLATTLEGSNVQAKLGNPERFRIVERYEFSLATRILDELTGIKIRAQEKEGPWLPQDVRFGIEIRANELERLMRLEALLNAKVSPIAQLPDAEILVTDSGILLLVGDIEPGVFLVGNSFGEGIDRLLKGKKNRPIFFSATQDPKNEFRLDGLGSDSPDVLIPDQLNGLVGVDTIISD